MAYRLRICQLCYNKLHSETLADIYNCPGEPADWAQYWYNRTVFLGNLPYRWEKTDIESWVWRNVFPHRDDQLPLFYVRAEKGGLQGDHGCAKKVFKGFAFLEFQLARDAKVFLERAVGRARPLTMASRSVVVRPALIAGSWIWLPSCHRHATDQWVRTLNYQRIDKIVDRFLESAVEPEICAAAST